VCRALARPASAQRPLAFDLRNAQLSNAWSRADMLVVSNQALVVDSPPEVLRSFPRRARSGQWHRWDCSAARLALPRSEVGCRRSFHPNLQALLRRPDCLLRFCAFRKAIEAGRTDAWDMRVELLPLARKCWPGRLRCATRSASKTQPRGIVRQQLDREGLAPGASSPGRRRNSARGGLGRCLNQQIPIPLELGKKVLGNQGTRRAAGSTTRMARLRAGRSPPRVCIPVAVPMAAIRFKNSSLRAKPRGHQQIAGHIQGLIRARAEARI